MASFHMLAIGVLLLGACSPVPETSATVRVGRVVGTDAFVGIAMDDDLVFAYVCDGVPTGTSVSAWFVAASDGTSFTAANPSGASLQGEEADGTFAGTLVASDGTTQEFSAMLAIASSGLYFGELDPDTDTEAWGGWIIDGGEQRGAVVDRHTGDIVGSPSINPASSSVDVDGAPLEFAHLDGPLDEDVEELPPGG